ncbi:MAG: methionine synthase, partial [Dehalococcoidia bacterium]
MKRSESRILTTHVGSLVRPPRLVELMGAKERSESYDPEELATEISQSVREVVRRQVESGVDIPSDGEYGKPSFSGYANERLAGFEPRPRNPDESPLLNWGRDRMLFREFYEEYDRISGSASGYPVVCTGPITYQGQEAVQRDISNFRAALAGVTPEEAFIPA